MLPPTGASPTFSDDAFGAQTVYSGETVTSALRGTCSVCCSAAAAHGLSACSAAYLMRGFLSILVVEVAHDAAPGWGPVSRRCAGWRTQFSRRWRHLHHVSGSGSDQCARDQRERHEHGGVVAGLRGERGRLPWGLAHTARPAGAARGGEPDRWLHRRAGAAPHATADVSQADSVLDAAGDASLRPRRAEFQPGKRSVPAAAGGGVRSPLVVGGVG